MSGHSVLVALLALTSCELIAGLDGDRQRAPSSAAGTAGHGEPPGLGGSGAATGEGGEAGVTQGGSAPGGRAGGPSEGGARQGGTGGGSDTGDGGLGGDPEGGAGSGGHAGSPDDGGAGGGTPLTTPSCSGLAPTGCNEAVNPCLAHLVPGGAFEMGRGTGSDAFAGGDLNEEPAHPVTVTPFLLDKYEVTVGRFRRFVEAYDGVPLAEGAGAHPGVPGSGWRVQWNSRLPSDASTLRALLAGPDFLRTWSDAPGSDECRPMNHVHWYLAYAFCIWDGGRLPSEAEWEFAAAGGASDRLFPWGSAAPDNARAVYGCSVGTPNCSNEDLPPVGSASPLGDGRFGHADLSGSLTEFVRDEYFLSWYSRPEATRRGDVMNLMGDLNAQESPIRGGAYLSSGSSLRSAARMHAFRPMTDDHYGVRCARAP